MRLVAIMMAVSLILGGIFGVIAGIWFQKKIAEPLTITKEVIVKDTVFVPKKEYVKIKITAPAETLITYEYVTVDSFIYIKPTIKAKIDTTIVTDKYINKTKVQYNYPDNQFKLEQDITLLLKDKIIYNEVIDRYRFWGLAGYGRDLSKNDSGSIDFTAGIDYKEKYKLYLQGRTNNSVSAGIGINF